MQFSNVNINKLRTDNLGEVIYWNDEVKGFLASEESDDDTAAFLRLTE
jgi:hypothetical protein